MHQSQSSKNLWSQFGVKKQPQVPEHLVKKIIKIHTFIIIRYYWYSSYYHASAPSPKKHLELVLTLTKEFSN